jgi:hypothetical protein
MNHSRDHKNVVLVEAIRVLLEVVRAEAKRVLLKAASDCVDHGVLVDAVSRVRNDISFRKNSAE